MMGIAISFQIMLGYFFPAEPPDQLVTSYAESFLFPVNWLFLLKVSLILIRVMIISGSLKETHKKLASLFYRRY